MLLKLRRAMRRRNEGYVLQGLVEVDETYVGGEEPGRRGRPGPDRRKKVPVAVALELDVGRVSVKAKSPEGLGVLGREEGVAAMAVVAVEVAEEG